MLCVRDVIYIAGLLITLGINIQKVNTLSSDLDQFKSKYASEVVPRQEHLQMNAVTEERWKSVQDRLTHVESQLENIKNRLGEMHR